jgi:hypothetical protein
VVGKHYQWHKKWRVDLAGRSCAHETGAVVDFSCVAGEWVGAFRGGNAAVEAWLVSHKFNPHDANGRARLSRIMKEASNAWAWQKNKNQSEKAKT